jgi:hypothetical protein
VGDQRAVGRAVDCAPFAGDFLAFDRLGEGGGRCSLAGLHVFLVVIQQQIHAALDEGGGLERRARMQRDEMRVETLGEADGYVETGGDRLAGIAMNQDRLVSHGGLRDRTGRHIRAKDLERLDLNQPAILP